MHWLPLIVSSAFALSLYDICKKHTAEGNRTFTVLLLTTLCGFAFTGAMLSATGDFTSVLSLGGREIALLCAKALIVSASWSLAYWALKTLPVTVMAPIRATGPVWTTIAAILLFAEIPTWLQACGFALAFTGCIAFSLATKREGFTFHSRAIVLAAGATLFGAASALYDKFLLSSLHLPPKAVLFFFLGAMSVIYAIATLISARLDKTPFVWRWTIPAVGILLAISDLLYFSAVASPDSRISIVSTIRRSSTIGTFLIGGAVFREKNLLRKGIALAAILLGVVLLSIA